MSAPQAVPTTLHGPLQLRCLGAATLSRARDDGEAEVLLTAGKPFALIAYLCFAPGRAAGREHLLDLLWADLEPEAAKHALRQAVWLIRQRLGADALRTSNGDLVLGLDLCADRDQFLGAIDAGDVERAVSVYAGDFLPGFAVPGGLEFEHWANTERTRLRLFFTRAAESLARRKLAQGHSREARVLAQRARDADSLSETGWRLLLETLISAGDSLTAAVEADRLERLLADEGRTPEPATRVMLSRARNPSGDAGARDDTSAGLMGELVGREAEFAAIVDRWQHAQRGPAQLLHLNAAAGLGKSRLLGDVYARLRASGARTILIRANPGERTLPYAFAADLAAALASLPGAAGVSPGAAAALVALNPSLSSRYAAAHDSALGADAHRNRLLALGELTHAVAHEAPFALLVDDVHWLDPQSRELLAGAVQRLGEVRVLVVTTGRNVAEGAALAAGLDELTLAPLTAEQIGALVASLGGLPEERWAAGLAARLTHATAGSPLLTLETLQLALETEILSLRDGRWACADSAALGALLEAGSALSRRIEALDRNAQWLLLLLSLAGAPHGLETLATAAGRPREAIRNDLLDLERRGLVHRSGDAWLPAHDEIAACADGSATAERLRAAHGGLGRALAERPAADAATLQRAGHHLAAAGDAAALASLGMHWIRRARALGDRRPGLAVLADLLGPSTDPGLVHAVHQRLPLALRVNRRRIAWLMAAGMVVVGLTGARLLRDAPRRTEAMLVERRPVAPGRWRYYGLPVTDRAIADGRVAAADVRPLGFETEGIDNLRFRPGDAETFLATRVFPDSGGQEVVIGDRDGRITRLTSAKGDDGPADWSPDGRYVVFPTDRWNQLSHSDLAILDLEHPEARPRPLTQSPESREFFGRWSPDGTRIAFDNWTYGERPRELCMVSVDRMDRRCRTFAQYRFDRILSWAGPHQIAVEVSDSGGVTWIAVVEVESGTLRMVAEGTAPYPSEHPAWLACVCRRDRGEIPQFRIFMIDHTDRSFVVEPSNPPPELTVTHPPGHAASFLDRLEIVGGDQAIPLDGPFQLRAAGFDNHDQLTLVFALRWMSSDTAVASIDPLGVVHPRATGTTVITATAGGWRTATTRLTVGPGESRDVRVEEWNGALDQAFWRSFGEPLPEIVTSPNGGPALWHHGDSTYSSGIYARRGFDASKGVGVEVRVSTPLTLRQWQNLSLELAPLDHAALERWDHRTGYLPHPHQASWKTCGAGYPGTDGEGPASRLALSAGGVVRSVAVDSASAHGGSWTWRLQVLPDGRCALAVNGQPVATIDRRLPLNDSLHIAIFGWSYGTRMLVERLEAWTGVRRDVDWSVLDGR
jgi:DNA-binding SARP family transcriptional activator